MNAFYLQTLLIYGGVDVIACLALNLQFGVSGIVNFSFIVFQATGAYTAAVLAMPPASQMAATEQVYVLGLNLPFPLPWIGAMLAGALLAIPVGLVVLRRLRSDYQAIAMLVLSVIANTVITNYRPLLNGAAGVELVPQPLSDRLNPNSVSYGYLYAGMTVLCVILALFVASRIVNSPFGRTLRAMREHELAATALGKNTVALKMVIFIVGGAIAALSGAILVQYITTWAPDTWLYPETIILFAAIIVGGRGNNLGAIMGGLLVPLAFEEAPRFIPEQIGSFTMPSGLVPAMEWVVIGLLIIGFLWFRPKGVIPERRRVFEGGPAPETHWIESGGGRAA
jgi:branched-chain amino acid transport system permease protein